MLFRPLDAGQLLLRKIQSGQASPELLAGGGARDPGTQHGVRAFGDSGVAAALHGSGSGAHILAGDKERTVLLRGRS